MKRYCIALFIAVWFIIMMAFIMNHFSPDPPLLQDLDSITILLCYYVTTRNRGKGVAKEKHSKNQ